MRHMPFRKRGLCRALLLTALTAALAGCGSVDECIKSSPISHEGDSAHEARPESPASFEIAGVPDCTGSPFVEVSGNVPAFTDADLSSPVETYAPLDSLGRCGSAMAVVSRETMPTEERGSIGMVKPSGWHTVRYDDLISDRYLYNRCHLIGYQLTAENANEQNLITGTRYLNVEGMLPFENEVADYVEATGNRVLYRVTPIFVGDELVARGVQMEAKSVEDGGAGVSFNVFCHNVQPGIQIDYSTGESRRSQDADLTGESSSIQPSTDQVTYVLNVNSGKFHLPECPSVGRMTDHNRRDMTSTYDEMIASGHSPCANCLSR